MSDELRRAADALADARRVAVMTGAGISAPSGVPTFRGEDGLWRSHRPEELATPEAFARDPDLVWEWYDWRRGLVAACEPNAAHRVLADWSRDARWEAFTVVTQNVDGLHERAGTRGVLRYHGALFEMQCWERCGQGPWLDERGAIPDLPPRCPRCGGLARPGVVWFGEAIDRGVMEAADAAAREADVFLVVGTASVVYPAAGLVDVAGAHGASTIEINPASTGASGRVDVAIAQGAEVTLPALAEALAGR